MDKLRVSFSQIDMYLRCPKQYEFAYIKGLRMPPGVALLEGSAHHKAFEINNTNKIKKGKDLKANQLTEIFMEDFNERIKKEDKVIWGDEKENAIFARGKSWHQDYVRNIAPSIEPKAVEKKFESEIKLDGMEFTLSGIIDMETRTKVIDYKTTSDYGFREKRKEVDSSLQLSYYAHATNLPNVGYICLIKKANPEIGMLMSKRSSAQVKWALTIASQVVQAIQSKTFHPCSPSAWQCNPKWCGFFSRCRGKYEKVSTR